MGDRAKSVVEASRAPASATASRAESLPARRQPIDGSAGRLLALQQTYGNRYVGALLSTARLQRKTADGAQAGHSGPILRRECACGGTCKDCSEDKLALQRSAKGAEGSSHAPPIVNQVLRSSGQPLDPSARSFFESRYGQDFSGVRIHTGSEASASAASTNALAYTVGNNIVFGSGQYAPAAEHGRRLLAHELAHVIQQKDVASSSLQRKIPVGAVNDPAEHEADRMAEAALWGEAATPRSHREPGAVVRRAPLQPQKLDEKRTAKITKAEGHSVEVTRTFKNCPCSKVPDTRTGVFYNPDLKNLAIAYRHCHGSTTFDTYARTATDFSQGSTTGNAQIGIDVNVWGKNVQGRAIVELVGENQGSGPGVGGHAKLVLQGGKWRVILEPKFIRQLGTQAAGTNANQLEVNLGAKYGNYSVELAGKDLLSQTRDLGAAGCYELSSDIRICATLDVQGSSSGGSPNVTPGIGFRGSFGEGAREEKCYNCFCPAPVKKFTCQGHKHVEAEKPGLVPEKKTTEHRYYFHYDSTADSEESYLRDESAKNLSQVADLAKRGYTVTSIEGFASPEGLERTINDPLAAQRGKKTVEKVRALVANPASVPDETVGRSELLGRNPAMPGTHLKEAIAASGFNTAEEVTPLLTGSEILPSQMTKEFLDLFKRTSSDEWMQLFGLSTDSAIRPQVEVAVKAFIASEGKGSRPWEKVFRLLRFGAIHLSGTEMVEDKKTPLKPEHEEDEAVSDDDCKGYGAQAEKSDDLGPIDPELLKPTSRDAESDESCYDPAQDDINAGCKYELPKDLTGTVAPEAPDYAPKSLKMRP